MKAYVYVLHFAEKIGQNGNPLAGAQHYTGWTVDIPARLKKHQSGHGGRLPAVFASRGIPCVIGRVWEFATSNEARSFEWKVKHRWKNAAKRYCEVCSANKTRT